MTCKECKEQLHPDDPEQPMYLNGRWLVSVCDTCDYKGSTGYTLERMEDREKTSHLICEVKNCPIWKSVAQFRNELNATKAELVHVHSALHELQTKKKKGSRYKEYV